MSNIFQGGPTFSRGWGGGVQMLLSIETYITCDFRGGGGGGGGWSGSPIHPLDLHMLDDLRRRGGGGFKSALL